jgi:hypothetical protein
LRTGWKASWASRRASAARTSSRASFTFGDDVEAIKNIDRIDAAFAETSDNGLPIRVKNCSKLSTVRSLPDPCRSTAGV